jgi:hypothetical protein
MTNYTTITILQDHPVEPQGCYPAVKSDLVTGAVALMQGFQMGRSTIEKHTQQVGK